MGCASSGFIYANFHFVASVVCVLHSSGLGSGERRRIISGKNLGRLPLCSFTSMTPVIFALTELMSLSGDSASSVTVQKGCCFMARALICLLD